jgi:hypothetical protein
MGLAPADIAVLDELADHAAVHAGTMALATRTARVVARHHMQRFAWPTAPCGSLDNIGWADGVRANLQAIAVHDQRKRVERTWTGTLERLAVQRVAGAGVRVVQPRLWPVRVVLRSGQRVAVLDGLPSVGAAV